MTDRELMQEALEAAPLSDYSKADGDFYKWWYSHMQNDLMQPPLNEVGYRVARYIWDAALRERLAQPDAYGYASRLAVAIWEQHYKDVAQQWKPLDDLMGVLTQIDNMTAGLTRPAQPEQEPVAWMYDLKQRGSFEGVSTEYSRVKLSIGENWVPLYTAPSSRQWQGLTDQEIDKIYETKVWDARRSYARAIEAKLKERNT